MTTLETRIIEYHNYKTLFGPCLISFSIPILIPGLTLTLIGIYGNDVNFPKFGGWHIAGIVILSFAVGLLIIGIILRCIFKPLITPDIESHLTPAHSFYGQDNHGFSSKDKERMAETLNDIYKGPSSATHDRIRCASPSPDGILDSSHRGRAGRDSNHAFSSKKRMTETMNDIYKGPSSAGGAGRDSNLGESPDLMDKNGKPKFENRDIQRPSDSKHLNDVFKEMENPLHNEQRQPQKTRAAGERDVKGEDSITQAVENESAETEKHENGRMKDNLRQHSNRELLEIEVLAQGAPEKYKNRRQRKKSRRHSKDDKYDEEVVSEDVSGSHYNRKSKRKSRRKSRDEYSEKDVSKSDHDSRVLKDKYFYSEGLRHTEHEMHRNASATNLDELILGSNHATTKIESSATVHTETIGRGDEEVWSPVLSTDEEIKTRVRKLRKKKKKRKSIVEGDLNISELEAAQDSNSHSY